MTTRTYDLSEQVVPHQGEEAIADTPSAESPTDTTDGKRDDAKDTDPTQLDSNPHTEDETRKADDRVDVTNLAARRAKAKRSNPIPKLSTDEFSHVLKWIDRTAGDNPREDFGKVVVTAVREYAYRANKNSLNVLAAVVPSLLSSGNFDQADREALISLNNQVFAQRKHADDTTPSPDAGAAPPADSGTTEPMSAGGDAGGGAPGGGLGGQMNGAPDPTGAATPVGAPPAQAAPPAGNPDAGNPADDASQMALSSRRVKRGSSIRTADAPAPPAPPQSGSGKLHFDVGGGQPPVPVDHKQDNGDGTSLIQNEMGQPEQASNHDLYHDPSLTMPVTQPHPIGQVPGGPGGAPGGDPTGGGGLPLGPPDAGPTPDTAGPPAPPSHAPSHDAPKSPPTDKAPDPSKLSRTAEDNLDTAKEDTDSKDVEKPVVDTDAEAQASQYDRGSYDQNGPLLTDPDPSTDQNWPPKASAVDAIRLADMYVEFGLIEPEQKYQVVAGFEKMNSFIVKDRVKVLTALAETRKTAEKNRALVPQSTNNGKMPSMGRGSSLKDASRHELDHFLAL